MKFLNKKFFILLARCYVFRTKQKYFKSVNLNRDLSNLLIKKFFSFRDFDSNLLNFLSCFLSVPVRNTWTFLENWLSKYIFTLIL